MGWDLMRPIIFDPTHQILIHSSVFGNMIVSSVFILLSQVTRHFPPPTNFASGITDVNQIAG